MSLTNLPNCLFVLLSSLLLLTSCSNSGAERPIDLNQIPGETPASPLPRIDDPTASQRADGKLIVTLRDQNELSPAGIPVRFTGPKTVEVVTNRNGEAIFEGSAGQYVAEVLAGCTQDVIVRYGGRGTAGVIAGQTTRGRLGVDWLHRIGPGNGAYPSKIPYWPLGETIKLDYDVVDRCDEVKAPESPFPSFIFVPSSNLEVVERPVLRSNANALATVLLRCVSGGVVSVILRDSTNVTDQVDLASYIFFAASGGDDKVRCGQSG